MSQQNENNEEDQIILAARVIEAAGANKDIEHNPKAMAAMQKLLDTLSAKRDDAKNAAGNALFKALSNLSPHVTRATALGLLGGDIAFGYYSAHHGQFQEFSPFRLAASGVFASSEVTGMVFREEKVAEADRKAYESMGKGTYLKTVIFEGLDPKGHIRRFTGLMGVGGGMLYLCSAGNTGRVEDLVIGAAVLIQYLPVLMGKDPQKSWGIHPIIPSLLAVPADISVMLSNKGDGVYAIGMALTYLSLAARALAAGPVEAGKLGQSNVQSIGEVFTGPFKTIKSTMAHVLDKMTGKIRAASHEEDDAHSKKGRG